MTNDEIFYAQYLMGNDNKLVCGIDTAIKALGPSAQYEMKSSSDGMVFTKWICEDVPTAPSYDDIKKELEFQEKFCAYHQYYLDRATNYPDIIVLLNQLRQAMDESKVPGKGSDFYNSIKEVNDKFPKPKGKPPARPKKK
jgi:hypothetical protein